MRIGDKGRERELLKILAGRGLFLFNVEESLPSRLDDNLATELGKRRYKYINSCQSGHSYLVVNVCNVHDILDVKFEIVHQNTADNIGGDVVAGVTQMAFIVDCRTADVPADLAIFFGHKRHGCTGLQRVVKLD